MSKVIHCIAYTAEVHVQNYCNWPLRGLQFNCPFPRFIHNKGVLTVVLLFDFISYLPVPIYFYCVYARIQHLNLRAYWGRGGVGGWVASTRIKHQYLTFSVAAHLTLAHILRQI